MQRQDDNDATPGGAENAKKEGEKKELTTKQKAERETRDAEMAAIRAYNFKNSQNKLFQRYQRLDGVPIAKPGSSDATLDVTDSPKVAKMKDGMYEIKGLNDKGQMKDNTYRLAIEGNTITPQGKNAIWRQGLNFIGADFDRSPSAGAWRETMRAYKGGLGVNDITIKFGKDADPAYISLRNVLKIVKQGLAEGVAVRLTDPRLQQKLNSPNLFQRRLCKQIEQLSRESIDKAKNNKELNNFIKDEKSEAHSNQLTKGVTDLKKSAESVEKVKATESNGAKSKVTDDALSKIAKVSKKLDDIADSLQKTGATPSGLSRYSKTLKEAEKVIAGIGVGMQGKGVQDAFANHDGTKKIVDALNGLTEKMKDTFKLVENNKLDAGNRINSKSKDLNDKVKGLEEAITEGKKVTPGADAAAAGKAFGDKLGGVLKALEEMQTEAKKPDSAQKAEVLHDSAKRAMDQVKQMQDTNPQLFEEHKGTMASMQGVMKNMDAIARPDQTFKASLDEIEKAPTVSEKTKLINDRQEILGHQMDNFTARVNQVGSDPKPEEITKLQEEGKKLQDNIGALKGQITSDPAMKAASEQNSKLNKSLEATGDDLTKKQQSGLSNTNTLAP